MVDVSFLFRLHLYNWLCVVWARILYEVLLVWRERKHLTFSPHRGCPEPVNPSSSLSFPSFLSLHFLFNMRESSRAAGAEELILTWSVLIGWASEEYFFVQRAGVCSTKDILNTRVAIQGPGAAEDIYIWVPTPQTCLCDPPQRITSRGVISFANPVYFSFLLIILSGFCLGITLQMKEPAEFPYEHDCVKCKSIIKRYFLGKKTCPSFGSWLLYVISL